MTHAPAQAPMGVRRHAWIAVLVVGVALFIAVERTLVATQNPNFVPSAILLGAAIVPAAFLTFVYGRRLNYDVASRSSRRPRSSAGSSARSSRARWSSTPSATSASYR